MSSLVPWSDNMYVQVIGQFECFVSDCQAISFAFFSPYGLDSATEQRYTLGGNHPRTGGNGETERESAE